MEIAEKIVQIASNFVGQREVKGNLGWNDAEFQELMTAVGWERGQAWCAYFTELVWKLAFAQDQSVVKELNLLFSAGAVATWNNFRRSDWLTSTTPSIGSIVIFQRYKDNNPHWSGHAAIVEEVSEFIIYTIDGNTNSEGSREGDVVGRTNRTLNFSLRNGLRPLGFIYPEKPIV